MILSRRSLHEERARAMFWRCLHESSSGRFLGGSCIKILKDPLQQQQVFDNLVRFCWGCWPSIKILLKLYIRSCCSSCNPAYNLICYCSIATVACIWYIDFLPATLFGASCRCNSRERLSRNKVLTLFSPYSMIILVDP